VTQLQLNPRPLVVRYGALGDMVILTVLLRQLHARFGQPVDILTSGEWTRPLLADQPGVGELYVMASRKRPFWFSPEQRAVVQRLRVRQPSLTWLCDLDNTKTCWLLQRAGWRAEDSCEIRRDFDTQIHFCDILQRFANRNPRAVATHAAVPATGNAHGQLHVTAAQRADLENWLRQHRWNDHALILIQPGNKRTMRRGSRQRLSNSKYWPEENWAQVLRGLRDRHPQDVILLLGVSQEAQLNDEILQLARVERAFNVAHDLPVPRLMALAQRARGMVSVDTGPAHVAAAVGCAVVTLFGKHSPTLYAPRGPNARVHCLIGQHDGEQSMLGISTDPVLQAWDAQHLC
jgi:ADP-heptose:LPS heptosyltransferase